MLKEKLAHLDSDSLSGSECIKEQKTALGSTIAEFNVNTHHQRMKIRLDCNGQLKGGERKKNLAA
jgi:hypothetical protein